MTRRGFAAPFILIGIFLLLLSVVSSTKTLADSLAPNLKPIDGSVKFQGWETVSNYIIGLPYPQWRPVGLECPTGSQSTGFTLVNDGPIENFGFESHNSQYYGIVAFPKKYLGELKNGGSGTYYIDCDSQALANVIFTDKPEIPHGSLVAGNNDPTTRIDYIVTFSGVDLKNKKIFLSVSDGTKRTATNQAAADAFKKSLNPKRNVLDIPTASPSAAPIGAKTTVPISVLSSPEVTPEPKPENLAISSNSNSLNILGGLSLFLLGGIAGFVIGKRSYRPGSPPTTTSMPTNQNNVPPAV